jgi:DNA-binding MarR family transcriptional regulator
MNNDGNTQKDLTQRLHITSSSCGELISKLEQGKYLERRVDLSDKRTFNVFLTESGRKLAEKYREKSNVILEEWASDLTEDEQAALLSLLGKLNDGLEKRIGRNIEN